MCEHPVLETERPRLRPPVPEACARIRDLASDRRIADTIRSIPSPCPENPGLRRVTQKADGFARRGRPEAVDVCLPERPSWSAAEAGR
jgi:hypothetical protein